MSIVAVGTVFPLVFAIGAAYSGRNQAVKALGGIKVCECSHRMRVSIVEQGPCLHTPALMRLTDAESTTGQATLMFTYHHLKVLDKTYGSAIAQPYLEKSMELSVGVVKSMTEPGVCLRAVAAHQRDRCLLVPVQ